MKEEYKISNLPNNLTLASAKLDHSAVVAINILIKVGSRHESQDNCGISHLIEHMSFKGTKTRSAKQIAEDFDNIGAYFNAYTSRESTVFYAIGLKEHYSKLLEMLSDIVLNSVYDEQELEKEKNVIIQEIAQIHDNPDEHIFEEIQKLSYPSSTLGRPITGYEENVKSFTPDGIKSFVRENYLPSKVIVTVAGNLDHQYICDSVKKHFDFDSKNIEANFDSPKFSGGIKLIERDLDQVHLALSFPGVAYNDKDYYVAHVLSSILGDGMSSRLFMEVRENLGLVYSIQSFSNPYQNAGTFNIYAGTDSKNFISVIEAVSIEFKKICEKVLDEEINRAKNKFKSNLLMSREVTSQRASELAGDIAVYGRYIEYQEVIDQLEDVTAAKIRNLAEKIFTKKLSFAAIGNLSKTASEETVLKSLSR